MRNTTLQLATVDTDTHIHSEAKSYEKKYIRTDKCKRRLLFLTTEVNMIHGASICQRELSCPNLIASPCTKGEQENFLSFSQFSPKTKSLFFSAVFSLGVLRRPGFSLFCFCFFLQLGRQRTAKYPLRPCAKWCGDMAVHIK